MILRINKSEKLLFRPEIVLNNVECYVSKLRLPIPFFEQLILI